LRVSEACDLRWDDIDLRKRTIIVRRLKGSTDSVHYLERDEVNGLKLLHRQQRADRIKGAYVFINERGQPFAASCAEWSRISVPICAKVEHWVP
jgi:integrase